ncbi:glyoxalase [Trinickia dabaoshanensis]|uniref:Glyoxalase n=1 Tax=Trinickia dabaoshanensis TaxID=564714 RepID=A0A2N7VWT1_9BURK|nr:glyoxalase [Trinickia dabaoshanensis]PMS21599.1 glyoxalase [Trinickia dabaoshanensis]
MKLIRYALAALMIAGELVAAPAAFAKTASQSPVSFAVGPQYDTTHVYVDPEAFDRFTDSFVATFGGTKSQQGVFQVTPTPSQTISQLVFTPSGTISVFGFKTPIPYPFGAERTGYLVTDMDAAIASARAHGADVVVDPFPDPIGRDAIVSWPGGLHMQLYWHTQAPHYDPLQTVPENRVYVSTQSADKLIREFIAFSHGKVVSDVSRAPGIEIGQPNETYRRVRIESGFGKMTVIVSDGHLPYPFGRELTGYEVPNLAATLGRAQAAGVTVLVPPFESDGRDAAIVQFPGGYIAEIHDSVAK